VQVDHRINRRTTKRTVQVCELEQVEPPRGLQEVTHLAWEFLECDSPCFDGLHAVLFPAETLGKRRPIQPGGATRRQGDSRCHRVGCPSMTEALSHPEA
ncbi:uncharacterized protein METZ01_LOCUS463494, partial [marine metagenome]